MNAKHPTFHFNSWIPALLATGACTFLGHCFVRRAFITAHHRAHETYHHLRAVAEGRVAHLFGFLSTLARLLIQSRFKRVVVNGRRYFWAYWFHPEEIAARAYADANAHLYTQIGVNHAP